jgi:hypothetical protein
VYQNVEDVETESVHVPGVDASFESGHIASDVPVDDVCRGEEVFEWPSAPSVERDIGGWVEQGAGQFLHGGHGGLIARLFRRQEKVTQIYRQVRDVFQ